MTPQNAEGVAGASVPVNSLAEVSYIQPVEDRLEAPAAP